MFGFLPNFGIMELAIILGIALIIFGPGKLPEMGKALGRSINEFKRASRDVQKEINDAINESEIKTAKENDADKGKGNGDKA